jgi:hypothetical protein
MSQMNQFQKICQIWAALVMAAQAQRVIGYKQLANMTGLPPQALAVSLDNPARLT